MTEPDEPEELDEEYEKPIASLQMSATKTSHARLTISLNYLLELINRELRTGTLVADIGGEFSLPEMTEIVRTILSDGADVQLSFIGQANTEVPAAKTVNIFRPPPPPDDLDA